MTPIIYLGETAKAGSADGKDGGKKGDVGEKEADGKVAGGGSSGDGKHLFLPRQINKSNKTLINYK